MKPTRPTPLFLPPSVVVGVYRYTRVHVTKTRGVYTVYLETKKKIKGLALYDGKKFTPCTVQDFNAILNEG